jgi:hypothetical protein
MPNDAFDVDGPAQYTNWRSWQEREYDAVFVPKARDKAYTVG